MSKKYTFYPGCSSEGSSTHLDVSLRAIAPRLGIELEDLEDWNCCGASVAHVDAGKLAAAALTARNLANAREQGSEDVVTACAACYLKTHGPNEKIRENETFRRQVNQMLEAAGKSYDGDLHVRHICEVMVNDVGLEAIREQVTNPLEGLKVAGYVGCQTVRPFAGTERGGAFDSYEDPGFQDDFVRACGAQAIDFEHNTACCGGAISLMSPDRTLELIRDILQEAKDKEADVISTPCPLCQQIVEMYQGAVNKALGTDFRIPVVFYSQIMAVAFGMDAKKDACLDRLTIPADKLAGMAKK